MENDCKVKIQHVGTDGSIKVMKDFFPIMKGEVIDAASLDVKELCKFYEKELEVAYKDHILVHNI